MRIKTRYILAWSFLCAICGASSAPSAIDDLLARFDVATSNFAFGQDDPFGSDDDPFGEEDDETDPFAENDESDAQPFKPSTLDATNGAAKDAEDEEEDVETETDATTAPAPLTDEERAKYRHPSDVPDELKSEQDFNATLTPMERSILFNWLNESEPKTDARYFAAATRIAKSGRPHFAKILAAKALEAEAATPEECAKTIDALGDAEANLLVAHPIVGQTGALARAKVFESARQYWEDPKELRAAFDSISRGLPTSRVDAILRVRKGGTAALNMLIGDILSKDADNAAVARDVLPIFESEGVSALIEIAREAQGAELAPVAEALGKQVDLRIGPTLAARYYQVSDESARSALENALRAQYGAAIPTREEVAKGAYDAARGYYDRVTVIAPVVDGVVDSWRWDEASKTLSTASEPLETKYRDEAARYALLANSLVESPDAPNARAIRDLAIVAVSERAAYRVGLDAARDGIQETTDAFNELTNDDLISAIRFALTTKRFSGALIPTIILQDQGDESLCYTTSGDVSVPVQAATCSDRRVRYEALVALAKWNPSRSYIGSSRVAQALAWFATSAGDRVVVVATPHLEEASRLGRAFASQGYKIIQTSNGRDAILAAQSAADVEFVFATAPISAPDPRVIAQKLREDARTSDVPLLLGFQNEDELSRARFMTDKETNAYVAPTPYGLDAAVWATSKLFEETGIAPVPAETRLQEAKFAARALLNMTLSRPNVYDPATLDGVATRLLATPALFDEGLEYAATIKTAAAQNALIDLVGDARFDIQTRRRALQAFERQLNANGSLLRGPDIRRMYDRYNASEFENSDSQNVLSALLDVYEKATGR